MQNKLDVKLSNIISQSYFGSADKKVRGNVIVGGEKYFFKIQSWELCNREMSGYDFVKKYYPVPKFLTIVPIGNDKGAVVSSYEKTIRNNDGLLVDIFSRGVFLDDEKKEITKIIKLYGEVFKKTLVKSKNSSSDIFFKDRIPTRIENFYDEIFFKKIDNMPLFFINDTEVNLKTRTIVSELKDFFDNKTAEWCIASQCDPNDLNIGTKPVMLDFLGGGLNPLMAEFAILFWYSVAQGGYLSLKYNKESFFDHERIFLFQSKLEEKDSKLIFDVAFSRKFFLINYIEKVIQPLFEKVKEKEVWKCWQKEFKNYLAMRILGVFDVSKMENKDMFLSLGYLQFFYNMKLNKPSDLIKIIEKL